MLELCFCVSLVIHDMIVEAEGQMATRVALPVFSSSSSDDTVSMSPAMPDPYSLFRPREIFSLPSKRSRSVFEGLELVTPVASTWAKVPTEDDIRSSIADVHAIANFSPGCLVVALIYIERLRRLSGAMLLASTWQPTLLISILVAQKVWEDRAHLNVDFTPLCPELTLQGLNALERDFLRLLDYNVGVKAAVYTNWYFRIGSLCERNSMRIRPLDGKEAHLLEIGSDRFASRVRQVGRPQSGPLPCLHDGDLAVPTQPRTRAVIS